MSVIKELYRQRTKHLKANREPKELTMSADDIAPLWHELAVIFHTWDKSLEGFDKSIRDGTTKILGCRIRLTS